MRAEPVRLYAGAGRVLLHVRDLMELVRKTFFDERICVGKINPIEVKSDPRPLFVLVMMTFPRFIFEYLIKATGMEAVAEGTVFLECACEGVDINDFFSVRCDF